MGEPIDRIFDFDHTRPLSPQLSRVAVDFKRAGILDGEIILAPANYLTILKEIKKSEGHTKPPSGEYYRIADIGGIKIEMGLYAEFNDEDIPHTKGEKL